MWLPLAKRRAAASAVVTLFNAAAVVLADPTSDECEAEAQRLMELTRRLLERLDEGEKLRHRRLPTLQLPKSEAYELHVLQPEVFKDPEPWLDSPDSRTRQPPDSHQTAQTDQTARQARQCLAGV